MFNKITAVMLLISFGICSIIPAALADEIKVDTAVVVGTPRSIPTVSTPTSYGIPERQMSDPGAPQAVPVSEIKPDTNIAVGLNERPGQGWSSREESRKIPKWLWWVLGIGGVLAIYEASN